MNKSLSILTLSTFPFEKPAHGGQHRVANIVKAYRSAGHNVQSIGVLGSESYPAQKGFEPFPGNEALARHIQNPFLMEDWAIGQLFIKEKPYFNSLLAHITNAPDLIHVEHPWLFDFAFHYARKVSKKKVSILYGSANIEHILKNEILSSYLPKSAADSGSALVKATELTALREADAIACVSQSDLEWTVAQGGRNVILAANGVAEREVSDEGISEANHHTGHRKFALYCASAHPPNISGFFKYFGGGIGSLAPSERIVIAGGAGASVTTDRRFGASGSLSRLCISAGIVAETCLAGLLTTAHVIVLPIAQGGGTNLKTAEAIWSGKRIVATTTAFRGFEEFMTAPGVYIADDPRAFLHALREAMTAQPLRLSAKEHERRSSVLWGQTLAGLATHASTL